MRKRQLSEFMCIELLYDYKMGNLDPERMKAVEEGLKNFPRAKEEMENLNRGYDYVGSLSGVSVSEPFVEKILSAPKTKEIVFSKLKWKALPNPIRWTIESVFVAIAIVLFITQMPELFHKDKIELSGRQNENIANEYIEGTDSFVDLESGKKTNVMAGDTLEGDFEQDLVLDSSTNRPSGDLLVAQENKKKEEDLQQVPLNIAPQAEGVGKNSSDQQNSLQTDQKAEDIKTTDGGALEKEGASVGNAYLYRMNMFVENVDKVTSEMVQLIESLGGEKAGEVQLGWRRKSGSYFHFSLPKSNSERLKKELRKYAEFSISKSPHSRVMPPDTERYILWVEEKPKEELKVKSINEEMTEDLEISDKKSKKGNVKDKEGEGKKILNLNNSNMEQDE